MRVPLYLAILIGGCCTTVRQYPNPQDIIDKFTNHTKSYKIWDPSADNYYDHPYILQSAFYGKKDNLNERYGMDKKRTFIFADSGGYQLATGKATEKNWSRKMALDWAEENATYTAILDWPARSTNKSYTEALDYSVESAKYIDDNRVGNCKVVNVLSGHKPDIMESWFNKISKYEFEGWAHGGSDGNLISYVEGLLFLINKGVYSPDMKQPMLHHILGVTHSEAMLFIAYIQRLLNEMSIPVRLTYDSSSASMAIGMGKWFREVSLSGTSMWSISKNNADLKKRYKKYADIGMGCDCPVCRGITNLDEMIKDETYTSNLYLLGWLHNVYLQIRFKNNMDSMMFIGNHQMFKTSLPAKISKALIIIDNAFKNTKKGIHTINADLIKLGYSRKNRSTTSITLNNFF